MPAHRYVEEIGSAAMLVTKRSAGVAPEVNLRHASCMPPPSMNKAAYSGFESQRRRHQESKTRVSVAQKKDLCPPKILQNKMHSNRMRTIHCSCRIGGVGVCLGGVCLRGCLPRGWSVCLGGGGQGVWQTPAVNRMTDGKV